MDMSMSCMNIFGTFQQNLQHWTASLGQLWGRKYDISSDGWCCLV